MFSYGEQGNRVLFTNGSNAEGINVPVLEALEGHLGFDTYHIEPPDCYWGFQWPNGTWSGIVGELINGSADISLASLTATLERNQERKEGAFI